jgi:hypothetical protein
MATTLVVVLLIRLNVALSLVASGTVSPSHERTRSVSFLTRQHIESKNASLVSSDAAAYCGFDTQLMVECAELLYRTYDYCGCWHKYMSFEAPSSITLAAYRHEKHCLLGVSGQVNGADRFRGDAWKYLNKHDPVFSEKLCGHWTVRGFVMNAKKIFSLSRWSRLAKFLGGPDCSSGVTVIGTSWGGAIAELIAGCANQGRMQELQDATLPVFRVDRLYTFGAPPTALKPISNHATAVSPCFKGQRVFLASQMRTGATDLIAYSTGINGYAHARQDAIQLVEMPDSKFKVVLHACQSERTPRQPDWDAVYPFLETLVRNHSNSSADFFNTGGALGYSLEVSIVYV